LAKLTAKSVVGAALAAPEALRREHDYARGTRRSANFILTWGCTSKCEACTVWRRPRDRERELTCDEWCDVGSRCFARGARSFELFGGDIFLRKDVVVPLSQHLKSLGGEVHTATNSNLVDRKTAEALAECLDVVYISTDGVDGLHDEVRGVAGTFGRLNNCLEYFREARGDRRTPTLVCNTTVSSYNAHALCRIAEFAAESGYDRVDFEYVGEFNADIISRSCIGDYEPSPIFRQAGDSCLVRPDDVAVLREQLDLVHERARQGGFGSRDFRVSTVNIDVLSDDDLVKGTVPGRRCFVDRQEIVIDPYGNIVPCYFYDTHALGNVRDGDLDRSLETEGRRHFRAYRDKGQLAMCEHCIHKIARCPTGVDLVKREFVERLRHWRTNETP